MSDTIKMQAPANSAPITRNGVTYEIDASGCVSVPGDIVADLSDHGFLPVADAAADPATDPSFVPSEDVATMNRNELFAFIKAKGVVVSPPITNDELRKIAMAPAAPQAPAQPAPVIPVAPVAAAPAAAPAPQPAAPVAAAVTGK